MMASGVPASPRNAGYEIRKAPILQGFLVATLNSELPNVKDPAEGKPEYRIYHVACCIQPSWRHSYPYRHDDRQTSMKVKLHCPGLFVLRE